MSTLQERLRHGWPPGSEAAALLRQWPDGEPVACPMPCGECHLRPGERCDICGALEAGQDTAARIAPLSQTERIVSLERLNRIAKLEAQLQEAITHLREMTTVPDLNAVKQARRWLDSTALQQIKEAQR